MSEDVDSIRKALNACRDSLFLRPNVVATGIGYRTTGGQRTPDLGIVCSVRRKLPVARLSASERVPKVVDGVPVDVVETGSIRTLASRTERQRPAPGGVSIGHRDITAGTLGCLVRRDGQIYILSNNHVLANSNAAEPGDPILQPGPIDGGRFPADQIADLAEYVPISFSEGSSPCGAAGRIVDVLNRIASLVGSGTRLRAVSVQAEPNLVDAAIAQPIEERDVSPMILELGVIKGIGEAELGMPVRKSGRTTGLTAGRIEQVDVTVNVQYGGGRIARFTDQLMAGPMSQGGDSGSAVLDESDRLVGLLFAGSESHTIFNRIENVFAALRVGL